MPPQDPHYDPAPDSRREDTPGTRPRKLRPAVVLSVLAVIAVVASLVFFLRPADGGDAAAPAGTAPTSEAALPPAPEVTYYQQAGPPAGSPLEPVEPLQVSVSNDQVGTSLTKGLVGISLEATDLADPMLSGDNASLVKLFKEADQPVLRFGGNAVDRRFFWTSTNEAVPATGYKGDKAHPVRAVGPADLARLNTLLEAADATVSLTVDLGHYDPERAADMAKHATEIFGPRLLSFTVGNEPNGFGANGVRPGGYSTEQYVEELKAYAKAMNAVAPNVPISGPGAYDRKWWQPFIDADIPQKKILSFHNYPLHSCDGGDPKSSPTIANVMSPLMHQRASDYQQAALETARAAGIETWLPETGIAACPGSNETSRTHASALWTADYALNAAQLGITRIGFHSSMLTCKGGPPMSAICSGGAYLKPDGNFSGRANFFGISMVAEMEGGKYLKLDSKGGGLMYSYALRNDDGSTSVVLVNQNDPEKAAQTEVTLNLPERALTGTMTQMSGPSFAAEDSTVIDGAKSEPIPLAERATVEGFAYGSRQQTFKLTAGTVTVLNFKH
ncbi:hypothetical protein [Arthrobacter sp. EPSL27]|uniref:hypothetical protein n=1 Tax=Arthrobacter sp. EPSL27 TaxID=1745378 RepID=UPI000AE26BB7|nr:hypothetical protein [Arthrobacter sp. EPSL27]